MLYNNTTPKPVSNIHRSPRHFLYWNLNTRTRQLGLVEWYYETQQTLIDVLASIYCEPPSSSFRSCSFPSLTLSLSTSIVCVDDFMLRTKRMWCCLMGNLSCGTRIMHDKWECENLMLIFGRTTFWIFDIFLQQRRWEREEDDWISFDCNLCELILVSQTVTDFSFRFFLLLVCAPAIWHWHPLSISNEGRGSNFDMFVCLPSSFVRDVSSAWSETRRLLFSLALVCAMKLMRESEMLNFFPFSVCRIEIERVLYGRRWHWKMKLLSRYDDSGEQFANHL